MSAEKIRHLTFFLLIATVPCAAQTSQPAAQPASQPASSHAQHLAFEVVSIRPSKPGGMHGMRWGTTPDGYHTQGQSLADTILIAYFPQGLAYWHDRLSGGPSWLTSDLYDIDAKVSEADLAAWQKQGIPLDQKPMLQQMLQSMLAERCHLVFHRVRGSVDGYRLELARSGARLSETHAGDTLPQGVKLTAGGILVPSPRGERTRWSFYNTTMDEFVRQVSMQAVGHPVQDHTGLIGRYNFALNWISDPDRPEREGSISGDDPDPLSHWDFNRLGLRIIRTKLPIDNLAIDHIGRPSQN